MTSAGQAAAFAGVIALAAISPGPDFAVVVRRSVVAGRRHGVVAGLGVATGVFVWSVAAAMGVAAVLEASAVAFTVVKLAGAAYLLWLGVTALLAARRGGAAPEITTDRDTDVRLWVSYRNGVLCNVFNPKCGVFFMAVLPQFVPIDGRPADVLLLSSVAVIVTISWFTVVATLVAALRRVLARPRVRRAVDAATGAVLVALGLRLATAGA
ncbi:lysine transporter LysE [Actinoplanes sp. SE50]|uniref:LysE family translocator n=1 Tax=unclassified Actinoplanes TaxID=2626549 RepID=UPI00023ECE04|nr:MULTISPECIES: LysE family translocator [unclassified Actinoplanes]AEV82124.1 Leucine efflux protein [Actinoplanes sp. SE50/110]ATO80523.1 lysine transporter LysE [Actinoplanes sp. SE50]SLL97929.1 lysine transporter LysE [Actinoplanes sp. SE50/110]